jgi:sortase A
MWRRSINMGADLSLFAASAPRKRPRRLALLVIERVLLLVALAAFGYVAGNVGGAALYQDYESKQLDAVLRGAQPAAQTHASTAERRVLGRLEIPTLGVSTIVREGEDARTLQLAVGHIAGTALPGAAGNMGLAGHRDTFFRRLREIDPGDVIRLVAVDGTYTYVVDSTQIVDPDDLWVLDPTPEPSLTLVTCYPFTYLGSAPERFIVRARLVPNAPASAKPLASSL